MIFPSILRALTHSLTHVNQPIALQAKHMKFLFFFLLLLHVIYPALGVSFHLGRYMLVSESQSIIYA